MLTKAIIVFTVCMAFFEGFRPSESKALLVPEGCFFDHIHNFSQCWPSDRWNQTGADACQDRSMQMRSSSMLTPCGTSLFSGVQFVCCPKHFTTLFNKTTDECIECSSNTDVNCVQHPDILEPRNCDQKSSCYVRVVNGVTIRGCLAHLDKVVQANCMNDTSGTSCMICENADGFKVCNNEVFPQNRLRCHSCMDNDLKRLCFTAMDGNAPVCKRYDPDDRCYIRRTAKSIERGCLSETTKCKNPAHCFICAGDGCNNKIENDASIPLAPNSVTA